MDKDSINFYKGEAINTAKHALKEWIEEGGVDLDDFFLMVGLYTSMLRFKNDETKEKKYVNPIKNDEAHQKALVSQIKRMQKLIRLLNDTIEPDAMEKMYKKIKKVNVDMCAYVTDIL